MADDPTAEADEVHRIATRHGVPADAAVILLAAIRRGGGRQAQFSHPALGGMGQWSRGGGIMIGDMFDHDLKARVERLCRELAEWNDGSIGLEERRNPGAWWPEECGTPTSSGRQNATAYAFFPETRRLAIRRDGEVRLYDTGDHRITGASQQQGSDSDLAFISPHGSVRLHELAPTDSPANASSGAPLSAAGETRPKPAGNDLAAMREGGDVFDKIERLHALHSRGILGDAEFAEKKKELLARI